MMWDFIDICTQRIDVAGRLALTGYHEAAYQLYRETYQQFQKGTFIMRPVC